MSWLETLLIVWLTGHVIPPVLYIGYGFVMSAIRDRDEGWHIRKESIR